MNIENSLEFHLDRPSTLSIHKTEKLNYIGVGLLKDQLLRKHKTLIPTTLTVIEGSISFSIDDSIHILKQMDVYQIPVDVEHEVSGLEERNIFTLIQERG